MLCAQGVRNADAYRTSGGTETDLQWDLSHGIVKLVPPLSNRPTITGREWLRRVISAHNPAFPKAVLDAAEIWITKIQFTVCAGSLSRPAQSQSAQSQLQPPAQQGVARQAKQKDPLVSLD